MTDITIPNVGESVAEVTIASWFKQPGDAVKKDEALVEIETDKASQELVAPEDGTLSEVLVAEGETVAVGTLIAKLGEGGGTAEADKGDAVVEATPATTEDLDPDGASVADEGSGESVDIAVPNVGESVAEVTVASWMKSVGDSVEKDEAIVELETDKASQELVAPQAGVISEILVREGDVAKIGDVLARLGGSGGASAASASKGASKAAPDNSGDEGGGYGSTANAGSIPDDSSDQAHIMPAAAKIIREENLDPAKIEGTGKGGRITKADALKAAKSGHAKITLPAPQSAPERSRAEAAAASASKAPAPTPAAPKALRDTGEREERVRMSRMRQTIARRLKDAQNTAAMLTTYNEADMSEIMALRKKYQELFVKKHDVKLGFMSFFIKACCQALKEVPEVNAEIDGTDIIYKNYYNISIAVSTPNGLVVPVVRDADQMSLGEIELEIGRLAGLAREGKLPLDAMSGGTFSITNGGVFGSLMSSPILNPPQSGILGMHKIEKRPVVVDDAIVIRPMMYLALSYDHRIVDGKGAVTFLVRVKECLEDPERLLLDL